MHSVAQPRVFMRTQSIGPQRSKRRHNRQAWMDEAHAHGRDPESLVEAKLTEATSPMHRQVPSAYGILRHNGGTGPARSPVRRLALG